MAECKIGKNKVRTSTKNTKMAVSAELSRHSYFCIKILDRNTNT